MIRIGRLETTLERACKTYYRPPQKTEDIEQRLLREFQRKYHHYSQHIPESKNTLEWFSLMQHHGAPTRLLDFTYSFYVAAYFALEKAERDCAVWAINNKWAGQRSRDKFKKGSYIAWQFLNEFITEKKEKAFNEVFMRPKPKPFACPQNPYRLNERLTIQKSLFMCPGDVASSFEDNLRSLEGFNKKENIKKIIISHEC